MQGSVEIKKVEKTVITEEKVYNLQLTHKELCSIIVAVGRSSLEELFKTARATHPCIYDNYDIFTENEYKDYCNFYDNMRKLVDNGK